VSGVSRQGTRQCITIPATVPDLARSCTLVTPSLLTMTASITTATNTFAYKKNLAAKVISRRWPESQPAVGRDGIGADWHNTQASAHLRCRVDNCHTSRFRHQGIPHRKNKSRRFRLRLRCRFDNCHYRRFRHQGIPHRKNKSRRFRLRPATLQGTNMAE
jgi:hypothetical protein